MTGIQIDYRDRRPIYEQLIANIREMILRGALSPDEQLPSVRALAAELAINPNTIQKAYAELERQGMIYSSPGRGSFVCPDPTVMQQAELAKQREALTEAMHAARRSGLPHAEAIELIDTIWRHEDDPN